MSAKNGTLAPLQRWSPALFLLTGVVLIGYASLFATEAFMDTYPAVRDFIGPVGYIIGFVGLLGLYPALTDRSPKLARAGAGFAVVGIVGWLVSIILRADLLGSEPEALGAVQAIAILIGMILAFLVFAIAVLRTDVHTRTVGLVLLGPFLVNLVNFGIISAGYASPEGRFVTSGLWALSYLAIGIALRNEGIEPCHSGPQPTQV